MKNGDKVYCTADIDEIKKGDKGIIEDISTLTVHWTDQKLSKMMQVSEFKKIPFEESYTLGDRVVRTKAMRNLSLVRPGEIGIIKETTRARYHMVSWTKLQTSNVMHIDQIQRIEE